MKNLLFVSFIFFVACNSNSIRQTKAHITERKMMTDGKLMVSYIFSAGDKPVTDSEEVMNAVIPHDSVTVVFFAGNPQKNQLKY